MVRLKKAFQGEVAGKGKKAGVERERTAWVLSLLILSLLFLFLAALRGNQTEGRCALHDRPTLSPDQGMLFLLYLNTG